ncbi:MULTISPECIES: AAA family ATPase [Methylobacterium]|uniref:ATP-dependent DNA helicase n=1 Tax=Methylobacterium TaxID=407 RepID=UPI0008F29EDF|nr:MULTISPECIES: AAA family ATPase [Methylobacterium]MBZ6414068.1 ATP-dependent RecD-like DNA helicase [Methylobacterium sp.]MBK3397514.1 AAA family ATPase [Methylobacterium ajmalii]MBK3406760.1 AAA family ATPase [Methylobacterium ajmalii]MBK3421001.1 AAA family ATPase [Methylobacterium ajmalii]SFF83369.1 exodeoxyribonuclease-5 [Methylobacterium sp. yr596]
MSGLGAQQEAALKAVSDWLKRGSPQVFRLFGFAGTGKTTLAKRLAEDVDGGVLFCAYTGKAASVMRARGCLDASTIHSLIYRTREDTEGGPAFTLNRTGPVSKAALVVIDECSMVDGDLGNDLLSFDTPVLVLGDPAQLPPVKGGGFFTEAEPDVMLTEVHRQAADNPIVRLAMTVREGGRLEFGTYGDSRVIPRRAIDPQTVLAADQVLVGMNRTRRLYNGRIRELIGHVDPMPAVGEKLVCLRNDRTKGLLNGSTWTVQALRAAPRPDLVRLDVVPEDDPAVRRKPQDIRVLRSVIAGSDEEVPAILRRETEEFTYGYALTVHKAQGSQWDKVVLFDESYAFREHRARWLYTALTRAADAITVVV